MTDYRSSDPSSNGDKTRASGRRRVAVLGAPISHSLSPALHRAAYRELGLDWTYDAYQVDEVGLGGFLGRLDDSWAGLSLTMPLKRAVIGLLDEVSQLAVAVQAVNTVLFDVVPEPAAGADEVDGGRAYRRGENTDIPGMVAALAERGVESVGSAAILGGGATAASAVAALRQVCHGDVTVYVRNPQRAAELRRIAEVLDRPVRTAPWVDVTSGLDAELVIATTPAGATDELALRVPAGPGALFDVVYHPWPTPLADAWARRDGVVVAGLDLLVHQAVLQVELMTGEPAPLAAMRAAGEEELAARAAVHPSG